MMSNNRTEYASAAQWLSALRQDGLWLSQLQQLEAPEADRAALEEAALRKIGQTLTYEFWDSYQHRVEPVVAEVWGLAELSLPKLKIQTIGMLSMEWLEQHAGGLQDSGAEESATDDAIIDRLRPIFYGSEEEARAFLESIQDMKPRQITDKVKQLVGEKKISELSSHRDLWKVLYDAGLYTRSESNWNMQVK